MTETIERLCEKNYEDYKDLPFTGDLWSVTCNLGNDFKIKGNQTDRDYRRLFNTLAELSRTLCNDEIHFVMLGRTSFTHESAEDDESPLGAAHLHFLLYTNSEEIKNKIAEKVISMNGGKRRGVNFNPDGKTHTSCTNEVMDYVLPQGNEPEPLLASDLKNIHVNSVLKTVMLYPSHSPRLHEKVLTKWLSNTERAFKEFTKSFEVEFGGHKHLSLGLYGVLDNMIYDKFATLGRLCRKKVLKEANITDDQIEAARLELTRVEDGFIEWVNQHPLVVCYCVSEYWNAYIAEPLNESETAKLTGYAIPKLRIYTKPQAGGRAIYKVMRDVDGRTKEGRRLKEEGWLTEK